MLSFTADLPIARKLLLTFGLIVLTLCGIVVLVLVNLGSIRKASAEQDASVATVYDIDQVGQLMLDLSGQVRGYLLTWDEDFALGATQDDSAMQEILGRLRARSRSAAETAEIADLSDTVAGYMTEVGNPEIQLGGAAATRDQALAIIKAGANTKWMNRFKSALNQFGSNERRIQAAAETARQQAINLARTVILLGAGVALLLAVLLGWWLYAGISIPITRITAAMRQLARLDMTVTIFGIGRKDEIGTMADAVKIFKDAGLEKMRLEADLEAGRVRAEADRKRTEAEREAAVRQQVFVVESIASGLEKLSAGELLFRLDTPFRDDYEKLRTDFNTAMQRLQAAMQSISANTQGVHSGAAEITKASDDLSRRTEQQAASLEETAAALDEITATVRKTAEAAAEARTVVSSAKTDAETSGRIVNEAVSAMSGIATSSKQIGNIIGVIDEIAFQTNLLALNAGVEAARAGDAGRGFAVVATEVRALAQRSADAAKEIKGLISASGTQVDAGVKLVGETGRSLTRIVEQVARLNSLVSEIAASAQEQATGLNEVNTAVNQMDQVTQQNAAMVEQATAASHSMAQEAQTLTQLVRQFQIGDLGGGARPAPVKPQGRKLAQGQRVSHMAH